MKSVIYNLDTIRPPLTGIGRYAWELSRGGVKNDLPVAAYCDGKILRGESLATWLHDKQKIQFDPKSRYRQWGGYIPFLRSFYRARQATDFTTASREFNASNSVYHNLAYGANNARRADITTIFDLSHKLVAKTHPRHRVAYLSNFFRYLQSSDEPIITISESVKDELCDHYDMDPNRIFVTHLAADKIFRKRSATECENTLNRHGLNFRAFLLCVGTLEPRKNLQGVLDAFTQLSPQFQKQFPLVIVGPPGWKSTKLEQRIEKLQSQGVVKRLGFVSDEQLSHLLSAAQLFLYPSLYEGFGLPLLEAMQCGCPCITSATGALNEVADTAALQVDPRDQEQIANAILHLVEHPNTAHQLRRAGIQRAAQFSWQNTVDQTWQIYASI